MNNAGKIILLLLFLGVIFFIYPYQVFSKPQQELELQGTIKHVSTCYGDNDAYIKLSASGGQEPYLFSIDGGQNYYSNGEFLNLYAGTYQAIVKDALDSTDTKEIVLTQPEEFNVTGQITHVKPCHGNDNGTLKVFPTGGTEPYRFTIDDGASYQQSTDFYNLSAGFYTLKANDAHGCTDQFSITIQEPDELVIEQVVTTDVTPCFGDTTGAIAISAFGGQSPFTYSLNGGSFQSENAFFHLAAGQYSITVKDALNCAKHSMDTIFQPPLLQIDSINYTHVSCYQADDATINIYASGGTPDLTYSLNGTDNFQLSSNFSGLSQGNYSLTVKDANGCSDENPVEITQPDEIMAVFDIHHVDCAGNNTGHIGINASGGVVPFQYSIDNGGNYTSDFLFQELSAGTYDVVIRDTTFCTKSYPVEITEPEPLIIDSVNYTDVACNGENTGNMTLYASGGVAPFRYSIDNGQYFQYDSSFTSLPAAQYPIMIEDENDCFVTRAVDISEPVLEIDSAHTNITCYNAKNGFISISASGDNPPYMYSLNGGDFQSQNHFSELDSGSYSVVVKGITGCEKEFNFFIAEPDSLKLDYTKSEISCFGDDNGKISLSAQGGIAPYVFKTDAMEFYASENVFDQLSPGTYRFYVKDANGCQNLSSITFYEPALFEFVDIEKHDISCYGYKNGSIKVHMQGGTRPYEYSKNGGDILQVDSSFNNLSKGIYDLKIIDAHGCTQSEDIYIKEPTALQLSLSSKTDIEKCYGDKTGEIIVSASGGLGSYQFSIDSAQTFVSTNVFRNLVADTYQVVVKDENECENHIIVHIEQPPKLRIEEVLVTDVSDCHGSNSGILTINPIGGTTPYQFSIDGGNNYSVDRTFTALPAGIYSILLKDANACVDSHTDTISEPKPIDFEIEKSNISCNGRIDGEIHIISLSGEVDWVYSIDGGGNYFDNQGEFFDLAPNEYSVIVKDENNCTSYPSLVNLKEPPAIKIIYIETTDVSCNSLNDGSIEFEAEGGTGDLRYAIDEQAEQFEPVFDNLGSGMHNIYIRDENNCELHKRIEIAQSNANCIEIPNAFSPNSDGINDTWNIEYLTLYPKATVQIFNRHGRLLHSFNAGEKGWDGTYENNPQPMGSYWYLINLHNGSDVIKGYFTLVR